MTQPEDAWGWSVMMRSLDMEWTSTTSTVMSSLLMSRSKRFCQASKAIFSAASLGFGIYCIVLSTNASVTTSHRPSEASTILANSSGRMVIAVTSG